MGKTHFEVDFGKLPLWKLKLVSKFFLVSESESKSENGFKTGIEVLVKLKPVSKTESKSKNGFKTGIEVFMKLKPVSRSESKSKNGIKTGIEASVKSKPVSELESKFQSGINCNTFKTATIFEAKLTVNEGFWEGNFAPKSDNVQKVFSCLFL